MVKINRYVSMITVNKYYTVNILSVDEFQGKL